jgi:hypothetical protein
MVIAMRCLSTSQRTQVVAALLEGNSIRATVRLTGICKDTVLKLLCDLGTACAAYHNSHVRNVRAQRIQCDEIWNFCYAKAKNVPEEMKGTGAGDVWNLGWDRRAIEASSCVLRSGQRSSFGFPFYARPSRKTEKPHPADD